MGIRDKGKSKAAKAADLTLPESELFVEDPLEALLDEQSDQEFGDLILRDAARKRSGERVKLAEWTAADFSSIYVRFRPHLERHARRFLNNPSQVDEVVQDAFLYLMVSLPELDSEIGVLRFLKWKTRLLALDVIRASGRAYINSIDDVPEPESMDPEVSSRLEQQDDAAVVKLALSKLNPRHREVLIASMYEEKSTEQIAKQVGLSENATRQLIFRARSAFKKALIGDVDTTGMSAAAILSVAARKAASEGKKVGASALALIALIVMSLSVWPALNGPREDQIQAGPSDSNSSDSSVPVQPQPTASEEPLAEGELEEPLPAEKDNSVAVDPSEVPTEPGKSASALTPSPSPIMDEVAISDVLNTRNSSTLFVLDEKFVVFADNGLSATFVFNPTSDIPFKDVFIEVEIGDTLYSVYPDTQEWVAAVDDQRNTRFVFFGSMNYVYDEEGKIWSESDVAKATVRLELVVDKNGSTVKQSSLMLLAKG